MCTLAEQPFCRFPPPWLLAHLFPAALSASVFPGQGDVELLQQWTGEACFNKLSSEAKQRKADGMVLVSQEVFQDTRGRCLFFLCLCLCLSQKPTLRKMRRINFWRIVLCEALSFGVSWHGEHPPKDCVSFQGVFLFLFRGLEWCIPRSICFPRGSGWRGEREHANIYVSRVGRCGSRLSYQDPHVLDVRQGEVLAIKADAGKANPTIALQFMCQQINCVRNK